jgi:hypothetical protein
MNSTNQSPDDVIRAALARVAGMAGDGARVRAALADRPRLHRQRRALVLAAGTVTAGAALAPALLTLRGPARVDIRPAPLSPAPPPGGNRIVAMRWRPTWLPEGYVEVGRIATVDDPGTGFQQRTWRLPGGSPDGLDHSIYLQAGSHDWFGLGQVSWRPSATLGWFPEEVFEEPSRGTPQVVFGVSSEETLAVALPNSGPEGMDLADRIARSVEPEPSAGCEIPLELGWLPASLSGHQLVRLEGDGSGELSVALRVEPGGALEPTVNAAVGSWPTFRFRCDEQITVRGQSTCSWTDPPDSGGLWIRLDDGREAYLSVDLSGLDGSPELDVADLVGMADSLRIGPPPDSSWAGRR